MLHVRRAVQQPISEYTHGEDCGIDHAVVGKTLALFACCSVYGVFSFSFTGKRTVYQRHLCIWEHFAIKRHYEVRQD